MTKKKIKFSIEGMHCGSCAAGVQMVLISTEGVTEASADYSKKIGEVEFDEEKVKWENLQKVIEELGYKATPAES